MADAALSQRLREHSQIISFANEVVEILKSRELHQEALKSADAVDKVKCKVSKSKKSILESIAGMWDQDKNSCVPLLRMFIFPYS